MHTVVEQDEVKAGMMNMHDDDDDDGLVICQDTEDSECVLSYV